MGHVRVRARVCSLDERVCRDVEALVDAGATLTVVPRGLAEELGLRPHRRDRVETGAGVIELERAAAVVWLEGRKTVTEVWVSDIIDRVLVGATTLEMLGLTVDPRTGRLREAPLLLYTLLLDVGPAKAPGHPRPEPEHGYDGQGAEVGYRVYRVG